MFKTPIVKLLAVLLVLGGCAALFFALRTTNGDRIKELLFQKGKITLENSEEALNSSDLLKKYYSAYGYKQTWTDSTAKKKDYRRMLIEMLNYADSLGIEKKNYHEDYLRRYDSVKLEGKYVNDETELENELIFTDAAITFLYHVAYGSDIPEITFNGVEFNIDTTRIVRLFNELLVHQNWRSTLDSLEPSTIQYKKLKSELNRMQFYSNEMPQHSDSLLFYNLSLSKHDVAVLKAYGVVASTSAVESYSDLEWKSAIKKFQYHVNIDTTGLIDKRTKQLLAFPLEMRIIQLKQSLNYWRWTGRLLKRDFVLVNIPAARLQIVDKDTVKDVSMRVIVGKKDTRTPSFAANITRVITYPYWTVPFSIATKEMLPKIRLSTKYLEQNNLQVIDSRGHEVNPNTIKWGKLSKRYFPYTIRQSTGCDNSLGVLKFDLNSPYSIYLHDTNHKELFSSKNRFLSHGCVRVEKPLELAAYLLGNNLNEQTIAQLDSCIKDQKPGEIKLKQEVPVLLLYMTVDVDENNNVRYFADVYEKGK